MITWIPRDKALARPVTTDFCDRRQLGQEYSENDGALI